MTNATIDRTTRVIRAATQAVRLKMLAQRAKLEHAAFEQLHLKKVEKVESDLEHNLAPMFAEQIRDAAAKLETVAKRYGNKQFCPTGPGGGVDPTCGSGRFTFTIAGKESKLRELSEAMLGGVGNDTIARLAGAPNGANVTIEPDYKAIRVSWQHEGAEADRVIRIGYDDKPYIENHLFEVTPEKQGLGIGTQVLHTQVLYASSNGIDRIECLASRGIGVNGYYTWPRLGYDASIPHVNKRLLPANLNGAERISDLMKTEEGRNWWKENGQGVDVEFDTRSGSQSRKVLDAYVAAKSAGGSGKSAGANFGGRGDSGLDMGQHRERRGVDETDDGPQWKGTSEELAELVFDPVEWNDELINRALPPLARAMGTEMLRTLKELGVRIPSRMLRAKSFCPTGQGGGVDPTCSPGSAGRGTGTKEDPVRCGANLDCATKALSEGKHIHLEQPDQVATLLGKMDKLVQKAVALGEKAPAFDLCKVSVPKTNLFCNDTIGIPRAKMPQMRGQPVEGSEAAKLKRNKKGKVDVSAQFIDDLKAQGIEVEETKIRASHLRASQNEIDGARVAQLVKEAQLGTRDLRERPIFVSKDNYVIDGHHHWAAIVGEGYSKNKDLKIPVYKLDIDIGESIWRSNEFATKIGIAPKTVPKSVMEMRAKASTATEWLDDIDVDLEDVVFDVPGGADLSMRIATEYPKWMKTEIKDRLQESFDQDYWKKVNQTTLGDIDSFLKVGLRDGWSIRRMAEEIIPNLLQTGKYAEARAKNIARTESGNALNGARVAAADKLIAEIPELPMKKTWLSVLGTTTRLEHANLDGVPANKNDEWNLGGVMVRWPGDTRLPPANRCNCQCTIVVEFGMDDASSQELIDQYSQRLFDEEEADNADDEEKTFCPTGPGGGVDPTCGSGSGGEWKASMSAEDADKWSAGSKWSGALYHVTSKHNVDSIRENGFRTANGSLGNGIYLNAKSGDEQAATGVTGDAHTLEVRVRVKNPLDMNLHGKEEDWKKLPDYDLWKEASANGDDGRKALLDKGYDAVRVRFGTMDYRIVLDPKAVTVVDNSHGEKGGPGSGNHTHLGRPGKVGGSGQGGGAKVDSEGKYIPGSVGATLGVDTSKWNKGNTYAQWAMKKIDTIEKLTASGEWLAAKSYAPKPGLSNKFVDAVLKAQNNASTMSWLDIKKLPEPMKPASPKQPEVAAGSKWEKIGPQLGSQVGGTYMFEGKKYYVKIPDDPARARNEVLAMRLYEAAGVPVAKMNLVEIDGKLATASEWEETTEVPWKYAGAKKDAAEHFAAHALLANWDAVGAPGDMNNIRQRNSDGKLIVVDAGGTMDFRAQEASGKKPFPADKVTEWDTLRDPSKSPAAAHVFGGMTPSQLYDSTAGLKNISEQQIADLVFKYGPGDDTHKLNLAETLQKRREIIINKGEEAINYELAKKKLPSIEEAIQNVTFEQTPAAAPAKSAPMSYPPKPQLSKTFQKHYGNKVDELWDAAANGPDAVLAVKTNPNASSPMPIKCHEYKMQLLAAMGVKGAPNPDHVQPAQSGTGGKPKINTNELPSKPLFATKNATIKAMNEAQVEEAWKHAEAGDLESLQQMKLHASPKLKEWHASLVTMVSHQLHPPPAPKKINAAYAKVTEHISGKPAKNGVQKIGYWNVLGDVGGVPESLPETKQQFPSEYWQRGLDAYNKLDDVQKGSLKSYTAGGYSSMNDSLRNGHGSEKALTAANTVMEAALPLPVGTKLIRKHSTHHGFDASQLKPGHVVSDRGVLSTSTSEHGWSGSVEWRITTGDGVKGLPAKIFSSTGQHESEVLLPPNQRILVTSVVKKSQGYGAGFWTIEAVALPTTANQCCPP